MCRCSQNTFVSLEGSSVGDHRSLMFPSFNPSTSPGGGARQGSLPAMCYLDILGPHHLSSILSHKQKLPSSASSASSDGLLLCTPYLGADKQQFRNQRSPYTPLPWGKLRLSSQPPCTLPSRLSAVPIFTHGQPPDPPPMGQ